MPKSSNIPPMVHDPIHTSPHGFGPGSAPEGPPSGGGKIVKGPPHMPQGGTSEHGAATVSKFKPGSGPVKASSDSNPHVSQPYDSDGDDWL